MRDDSDIAIRIVYLVLSFLVVVVSLHLSCKPGSQRDLQRYQYRLSQARSTKFSSQIFFRHLRIIVFAIVEPVAANLVKSGNVLNTYDQTTAKVRVKSPESKKEVYQTN